MADPSREDIANHEASRAVVWWWWVNQPDGIDDGTRGTLVKVSIEPNERQLGHFVVLEQFEDLQLPEGRALLVHGCVTALAGVVSDDLRQQPRQNTSDVLWVLKKLHEVLQDEEDIQKWYDELKDLTTTFLQRSEVQDMIAALTEALLERTTMTGRDAGRVIGGALSDDH